jgi:Pro-kumamolisin, activation domain/Bacterial Ig-like domain (group 3)
MKTKGFQLCRGEVWVASFFALFVSATSAWRISAQAAPQSDALQAVGTQAAPVPARVTQKVDEENLVTLHGNVHALARPEFDRGTVNDAQIADHLALLLKRSPDRQAALTQLLSDQQDKSSKNYHAWLTPQQFGQQFGPADSDIQAVTDWLTSHGFSNIKVSPGRTRIEFSGNISQVRNAFHTDIRHFLVNGTMHMAAASEPQLPAALAPVVAGIAPLHDFRPKAHAHKLGTFRRTKDTGEVKPLFTFTGCGSSGKLPCYAVGPGDFSTIYNVPSTINGQPGGTGVTIGIVNDSNINVADVQAYRTMFGLSNNFSASNIILNGPDPGVQDPNSATDDELEADLDVELSGGVAPGATINLVLSESSQSVGLAGTDLSAIYIVDNNSAAVLSESFGACEPSIGSTNESFYNDLWQQASAQGITVILSSGDSGSDSCDQGSNFSTSGLSVSGLASTQYNVAIGGTDFMNGANPSVFWNPPGTTPTSAKGYVPESTWNDSCAATAVAGNVGAATCTATVVNQDATNNPGVDLAGGGGGPSGFNAKPVWQTGITGNPADGFRDVPDLSFFAGDGINGSFYIVCQTDANSINGGSATGCDLNSPFNDFQGVGGTSAGAPAFAGIMALINQKTGQRQGNANFVLYQLYKANQGTASKVCPSAASPVSTCIFYDTTLGNNSVACQGGTPNCSNTTAGTNQFGVLVDPTNGANPAWLAGVGYDRAAGLGSVNVANLIAEWSKATFTANTVAITSTSPSTINIAHGTSVTFNVKVTPSSGTTPPTGSVSLIAKPTGSPQAGIGVFSENNPTNLSASGSTGVVAINTTELPGSPMAGTPPAPVAYPVVASYGGDGTFAPGTSAPVTVTVTPESSKTVVTLFAFNSSGAVITPTPTSVAYGSPYILQIAVQDSSGRQCAAQVAACPTGTVTLTDNGNPVNDFSGTNSTKLNSQGIAEDQPVQLAVSPPTHSLVATYSGDNSFMPSPPSAPVVITITKATPTGITLATSAATVPVNQNVTLTATISTASSGAGPTGTVTFKSGTTALGTAPVTGAAASGLNGPSPTSASGTATLTTSFKTAGAQSIIANYGGDGNYTSVGPSTAASLTVTAGGQATTTAVKPSSTSIASGASITFTATVTSGVNNGAAPTGTVQFMNGTTALGAAATCTGAAGTSTTPATCTAMLMTTLAMLGPPPAPPRSIPNLPSGLMYLIAAWVFLALLAGLRYVPVRTRVGYACAGLLLFTCAAAGISGCGGGGGTTPTPHTDSITAVYSGDTNYATSTSTAVSISVQ